MAAKGAFGGMGWRGWAVFALGIAALWAFGLHQIRGEEGPLAWIARWHYGLGTLSFFFGCRLIFGAARMSRKAGLREILLDEGPLVREIGPKARLGFGLTMFFLAGMLFGMPAALIALS